VACIRVNFIAIHCSGGLLELEVWARIDRNRLAWSYKYASIRPQIKLFQVAIEPPHRHQQTTGRASSAWGEPSTACSHRTLEKGRSVS
jgi:hypothetical protein